jgi:hypothetical protein
MESAAAGLMDGAQRLDAVEKGAVRHDSEVEVRFGCAEFLGTTKADGTDREQRDSARQSDAALINQSPVQISEEIWARVRDRCGEGMNHGVAPQSFCPCE